MEHFLNSIEYIEANLFEKITPDDIARVACSSTFHYCRLFKALVGDSVMGYVRKRRLSIAAQRLACEHDDILKLALECQFESHEAFTRAFKKMFHITPKEFKTLHNPVWVNFRKPISQQTLEHLQNSISMQPKIVERNEFKVIGISETYTQLNTQNIPQLWKQFILQINSITRRKNINTSYGVCNPINNGEIDYIAAVEVEDLDDIPHGMVGNIIPTQTYALFTHCGPIQKIHETISYIWATWLPNSPYITTGTPDFEQYDERFDAVNLSGEIDFYIPIIKQ